ncbi:uncharacterized protein [Triticum aestivum]|uniref:uncharacterized protein n=1 Tax=Triticum aestivum TaxID=4565 RepID=UPI001D02FBE3|nr:uncharacterized protein LOC123186166 [Triticum aestivum]
MYLVSQMKIWCRWTCCLPPLHISCSLIFLNCFETLQLLYRLKICLLKRATPRVVSAEAARAETRSRRRAALPPPSFFPSPSPEEAAGLSPGGGRRRRGRFPLARPRDLGMGRLDPLFPRRAMDPSGASAAAPAGHCVSWQRPSRVAAAIAPSAGAWPPARLLLSDASGRARPPPPACLVGRGPRSGRWWAGLWWLLLRSGGGMPDRPDLACRRLLVRRGGEVWWLSDAAGAVASREVGGSAKVQCVRVLVVLGILRAKAWLVLPTGGVGVCGRRLTSLEASLWSPASPYALGSCSSGESLRPGWVGRRRRHRRFPLWGVALKSFRSRLHASWDGCSRHCGRSL